VISVLIVDDQDLVREGLRMLLEAEPELAVAGEAADGSQALDQALCVPKTCATWAYARQLAVGLVPRLAPGGQVSAWPGVR
jgi:PleD family two-component response regulator